MAFLCESTLSRLFDPGTCARMSECFQALEGTSDFHSPVVWRSLIPELCQLDFSDHCGRSPICSAEKMMEIFRFFGALSLDLRDVPGLGHGRILSVVKGHSFHEALHSIASGRSFSAVCITEACAGSDLHALQTTATRERDGYKLEGSKQFVSRLRQANLYIVFANVPDLARGLSVFLVPAGAKGVVIRDIPSLGLHGCSWGALELNEVFVPKCHRVGGEGQGFSLFATHFSFWRCCVAATAIGAAQTALDHVKERLQTRHAFDGPIGRFTHLQQAYAQHAAHLHMAWLLVQSVAQRLDRHLYSYVDAAMVKAESVEAAIAAVQWAMLVHGAQGYVADNGLGKVLSDLLGLRIADGTCDVLRGQVARGLLGESLYSQSLGRYAGPQSMIRERQLW